MSILFLSLFQFRTLSNSYCGIGYTCDKIPHSYRNFDYRCQIAQNESAPLGTVCFLIGGACIARERSCFCFGKECFALRRFSFTLGMRCFNQGMVCLLFRMAGYALGKPGASFRCFDKLSNHSAYHSK